MLLDLKNCSGQLSWQENHIDINFDLSVNEDGSIKLTLKDISFESDVAWLCESFHTKKRYSEFLQLDGQDVDGNSITSNSVALNSLGQRSDKKGQWMSPWGTSMQLCLGSAIPVPYGKDVELLVKYSLLGFKCFGNLSGKTDLGLIELAGDSNIVNYDKVSGFFTIKTSPEPNFNFVDWLDRCDKLARSILDILSLANDRYITWASRDIFHSGTWVSSLFFGPNKAGEPSQPLFTHLNLQPILNLALTNYSDELKQKTGLNVAIEWFLIKSTYSEVQFLTAMTALEHLVDTYVKQKELITIFQGETFESIIKPQISEALDHSLKTLLENAASDDKREDYKKQVKAAKSKITEINRYPFKKNLKKFLKAYKIPLDGIEREVEQLVDVRNIIVHTGLYSSENVGQYTYDHLAVLRDLLKRIFLTLLKFDGEYKSFLNGPEWKKLQPLH